MTLLFLLVFSLTGFARSGSGVGNGGLGYLCNLKANPRKKITITLDLAEDLESHYSKDSFIKNELYSDFRSNLLFLKNFYNLAFTRYYDSTRSIAEDITDFRTEFFIEMINIANKYDQQLLEELTRNEYLVLQEIKKSFALIPYKVTVFARPEHVQNKSKDTGKITRTTNFEWQKIGLQDCKLTQILTVVTNFNLPSEPIKGISLYFNSFYYLDQKSHEALMLHELIYLSNGDENSRRTRKIVSKILK